MGARLVAAVVVQHPHLSDRAFRVAVRMALSALDDGAKGRPACVYFGGWEALALALGRDLPARDPTRPATQRQRRLASETVRRAIRELVDQGLVEPLGTAHRGSRQSYRLRFGGGQTTTDDSEEQEDDDP